jgi:hypothetical protein
MNGSQYKQYYASQPLGQKREKIVQPGEVKCTKTQ